jgi:flagellar biosynthetic protein FlhB
MNDDSEKVFEATPQRIEKAKREGNVARSNELGSNIAFAVAAAAVVLLVPAFYACARAAFVAAASGGAGWSWATALLAAALVPVGAAAAAAIVTNCLQTGGLHVGSVSAKLERVSPIEGLKRMLSRETLAHAARSSAAFALATGAMAPALAAAASELIAATTVQSVAAVAWNAVEHVAAAASATGLLFAVAEYGVARNAWLRKLRMSFEERKREAREQDGDPFARGRRRALHRSLVRSAVAKVKDASFVVANPLHVAIALEYRPPKVAVPRVLVRASGAAALRVRALAHAYRIPVVENVTLARALFRDARAGQAIARTHYVAVAEIVIALAHEKADRA